MKYDENYRSRNVQDLRGRGGGGGGLGGGGLGLLVGLFRRFGIGGVIVDLLILGGLKVCGGGSLGLSGSSGGGGGYEPTREEEALVGLVSTVLDDAQRVWTEQYAARGQTYEEAQLKLFTGSVASACGQASAATGPFYCPGDKDVYIDLSFYQLLRERLGAPGDFAQAYVIAHEVGHHVQNLEGVLGKGRDEGAKGGSVLVELQATVTRGSEPTIPASATCSRPGTSRRRCGPPRRSATTPCRPGPGGTVRPETFTHGTSQQRAKWFQVGLTTGSMEACDTFAAKDL